MTIEKTRKIEPPDRWFNLSDPRHFSKNGFEFNPKLMEIRQPERIDDAKHNGRDIRRFIHDVEITKRPDDDGGLWRIVTVRRSDGYRSTSLRGDLKRPLLTLWLAYTTAPISCLGNVPEYRGGRQVYCQSQHGEDW
jgi:hypothetical protein